MPSECVSVKDGMKIEFFYQKMKMTEETEEGICKVRQNPLNHLKLKTETEPESPASDLSLADKDE